MVWECFGRQEQLGNREHGHDNGSWSHIILQRKRVYPRERLNSKTGFRGQQLREGTKLFSGIGAYLFRGIARHFRGIAWESRPVGIVFIEKADRPEARLGSWEKASLAILEKALFGTKEVTSCPGMPSWTVWAAYSALGSELKSFLTCIAIS